MKAFKQAHFRLVSAGLVFWINGFFQPRNKDIT